MQHKWMAELPSFPSLLVLAPASIKSLKTPFIRCLTAVINGKSCSLVNISGLAPFEIKSTTSCDISLVMNDSDSPFTSSEYERPTLQEKLLIMVFRANPNVDTLCIDSIFCTDIPALRNDFSWSERETVLFKE